MLYREPKLLKAVRSKERKPLCVSVLYREPKLLKGAGKLVTLTNNTKFQCSTVSRNC